MGSGSLIGWLPIIIGRFIRIGSVSAQLEPLRYFSGLGLTIVMKGCKFIYMNNNAPANTDLIVELIEADALGLLDFDGDVADLFTFVHTPKDVTMSWDATKALLSSGENQ